MECIDFHTHTLPHMDHGCPSIRIGIEQLSLLQKNSVTTVGATPQFYPQETTVETFLQNREGYLSILLERMGDTPRPAIIPGAEVLICEGLQRMNGLPSLCLNGTNIMLLEMPFSSALWTERLIRTVEEMADSGIMPVLAHVDRYPQELVEPLLKKGIPGQINASSLCGLVKPRHLLLWAEKGYLVALGSDLHVGEEKRASDFVKVLRRMPDLGQRLMTYSTDMLKDALRV